MNKQMALCLGQEDMEQLLSAKLDRAIKARELARTLEHEYLEDLQAARDSGAHPRAELRWRMHELTAQVLRKPSAVHKLFPLTEVFDLVEKWPLRANHIFMNVEDARQIRGSLPWKPEEIPANAIIEIYKGEMSLVLVDDEVKENG